MASDSGSDTRMCNPMCQATAVLTTKTDTADGKALTVTSNIAQEVACKVVIAMRKDIAAISKQHQVGLDGAGLREQILGQ